jgi:4-hydroxy-tetrahydrodipicolinate synthase
LKFIVNKGLPRAVKAGLNILGEEGGNLRSPLKPLHEKETEELKKIIKKLKK